jgi:hypothetical protein
MHSRVARVMLVAGLLLVGVGAGIQLSFLFNHSRQVAEDRRQLLTQLGRFDAQLADLSAAQAAYVAPGQPDAPWFERIASLSAQLATEVASVHAGVRSPESATAIQAVTDALSAFATADTVAREFLALEQELMAADVVFGEGRDAITAARASTGTIAKSEEAAFNAEQAASDRKILLIVGGAAGFWVIGILLLLPRTGTAKEAGPSLADITRVPAPEPVDSATPTATVDLTAAADLCTALSRVVTSAALPDMLARAAALIDAPGVIVWMGSGDELFAGMSHGYDPHSIRRLGAIPRDADNATAEAWRTGELRTVAGDMVANGAIVAPMFGPDSCVGVLAAEVRHGREQDSSTQAVAMMIAAQLATVIGAWPAAPQSRAAEA